MMDAHTAQPDRLTYAVVTPARDERENLQRLAACLVQQTCTPATWLVVDDGSSDGSRDVAEKFTETHSWIRVIGSSGSVLARGGPIVRAFHTALTELEPMPDVIVKLDADISLEPDHFEKLLSEFAGDPRLGIAGGTGYEEEADGVWRHRHGTGPAVWGACRAYRRECLQEILPLEEHMGWDTLDLMKARLKNWHVKVFADLPFRHHRPEGERDGHPLRTYLIQGEAAHFMGYRLSYLVIRTLYRAMRKPSAVGLVVGFARASVKRRPRCADAELRAYVRKEQSLRRVPMRIREARRPRFELIGSDG
jgi:glycosyltransferase involved in cell wall biosynthesis